MLSVWYANGDILSVPMTYGHSDPGGVDEVQEIPADEDKSRLPVSH